jgi:hypothetical protein
VSNLKKAFAPLMFVLVIAFAVTLSGCAGSPVAAAQSTEAKADALYGEFVLAEEAAARVMQDANVPDDVKEGIQKAHAAIKPLVEELQAQRVLLGTLRVTKPDDVPGALLALNELILQLEPLIKKFGGK